MDNNIVYLGDFCRELEKYLLNHFITNKKVKKISKEFTFSIINRYNTVSSDINIKVDCIMANKKCILDKLVVYADGYSFSTIFNLFTRYSTCNINDENDKPEHEIELCKYLSILYDYLIDKNNEESLN